MLALAGCAETQAAPAEIDLTSPAFDDGAPMPGEFTCDGDDRSPPLQWSAVPRGTKQLVLVMADHDAADPPFIHWVVTRIGPDITESAAGAVPHGAREMRNELNRVGWTGPCPPEDDDSHRYVFTLTATRSTSPSMTEAVARDNVVGRGQLATTYQRD